MRTAVAANSGVQLPASGEPDDGRYEAAVAAVISRTSDTKQFRLLFNENRNYGYERTL